MDGDGGGSVGGLRVIGGACAEWGRGARVTGAAGGSVGRSGSVVVVMLLVGLPASSVPPWCAWALGVPVPRVVWAFC